MRVIIVGGTQNTMHFTAMASGWENLCVAFDTPWYSLHDAVDIEADVCLYIGTPRAVAQLDHWLSIFVDRKNPKWKKLVLLQEGGASIVNDISFQSIAPQCGFDAFFCYSMHAHYQAFGPVHDIRNTYPLGNFVTQEKRVEGLITLGTWHYDDPMADILGTLRVMQLLPDLSAVCHAYDRNTLKDLIRRMKLHDRVMVYGEQPWDKFLQTLASTQLCVSMDSRQTWGRLDLDCARVGIPCIGPWTAAKAVLFPSMCINAHDVKHAATLVNACLESKHEYKPTANLASYFSLMNVKEDIESKLRKL